MFFHFVLLALSSTLLSGSANAQSSAPTLVYPIQSQFPPIAHASYAFNFTLLPGTFISSNSASTRDLNYTVSDLPSWVSFDPIGLAFVGNPATGDAGSSVVQVNAAEGDITTSSNFTLTVVTTQPPYLARSMSSQLINNTQSVSSATILPSTNGVVIHPYYSFSLGFVRSTFVSPRNKKVFYSALTSTSTTLPSWLTFDNNTATFNGIAPLAEGVYDIVLVGSEVEGFGDVRDSLTIEIGVHALDLVEDVKQAVGLAETFFSHQIEIDGLRLDGASVYRSDLKASADLSGYADWLALDSTNQTLSGTPPASYFNGTLLPIQLPVTFTSISTNASYLLSVPLDIHPFPFTSYTLANTTALSNATLSYPVVPHLTNQSSFSSGVTQLSARVSPAEAEDWLTFDTSSGILSGKAPAKADYDLIEVLFTALDQSTGLAGVSSLGLMLVGTSVVPSTTSSGEPSSTALSEPHHHHGLSTGAKIAIGAAIGGVCVLLLLCLLAFCCIRRKAKRNVADSQRAMTSEKNTREMDGLVNVDLGPDPFAASRDSMSSPIPPMLHPAGSLSSRNVNNAGVANENGEGPRRLDLMKGLFAAKGASEGTDDGEPKMVKDLSGLPRSFLSRSGSDQSFYSGVMDDSQLIHSDSIIIHPVHNNNPPATSTNGPVPFGAQIALVQGEVPLSPADMSDSDSPTFSDVGSQGSRASWETSESFRWTSGDVGSRTRDGTVPSSQAFDRTDTGFSSEPSIPIRQVAGIALPQPAVVGRDLTTSTFADATDFSDSVDAFRPPPLGNALTRASTNFGSDQSIASPLSRFGDSSFLHGFTVVDEEQEENDELERPRFPMDDSRFASSEGDESFGTSSVEGPIGVAVGGDRGETIPPVPPLPAHYSRNIPFEYALSPEGSPAPPAFRSSTSSRPRPRYVPSRDQLPTISPGNDQSLRVSQMGDLGHHTDTPRLSGTGFSAGGRGDGDEGEGDASFMDAVEEENGGAVRASVASFYGVSDLNGLGYPATSAIYFAEPPTEPYSPPHAPVFDNTDSPPPLNTIRAIPVLGLPLPTPKPTSSTASDEDLFSNYYRPHSKDTV